MHPHSLQYTVLLSQTRQHSEILKKVIYVKHETVEIVFNLTKLKFKTYSGNRTRLSVQSSQLH